MGLSTGHVLLFFSRAEERGAVARLEMRTEAFPSRPDRIPSKVAAGELVCWWGIPLFSRSLMVGPTAVILSQVGSVAGKEKDGSVESSGGVGGRRAG